MRRARRPMRPHPVAPDARWVPSIAQQLRTARRRRARRRRVAAVALVAAPAALVGARLIAGASAEPASLPSAGLTTTTSSAPPTTPAATGLDPRLVDAFERARAMAADAGHELTITSGFRTAEEQVALLDFEVARRGSLEEALWWVFPPDRSMHVQGLAIDVGDGRAADWLVKHGDRFGLCRTLDWEWWHFEWRARWEAAGVCPAPALTPDHAPGR